MKNLLTEEVRNDLLNACRWFLEVTKVNFLFGVVVSLFLVPILGLCVLLVAITEPQINPDSCTPVPFDGCE
jgi:hypothetical protein